MLKTIRTSILEIAYEEHGESSAQPIIFLHGFPDDLRTWEKVAPALADKGFRSLVPYVRGIGDTRFLHKETPRSGQYVAFMQDLMDFADTLGIEKFILVGHDWGARAAYPAALLYPERIQAMVTLAAGFETGAPKKDIENPMKVEQAEAYWYQWYFNTDKGKEALEKDAACFCKELWKKWSPGWDFSKSTFNKTVDSFTNPDFAAVSIHSYRYRWLNAVPDPRYNDLEARLATSEKISVPTILLVGADDGASLPATSEGKEKYFSNDYTRKVLKGIGHFIPREDPDAVIKAVLKLAKPVK